MQWYIIGIVICAVGYWYLKRNKPDKKNYRQAVFVFLVGVIMAAVLEMVDTKWSQPREETRKEAGGGSVEKEYLVTAKGVGEDMPIKVKVLECQLTKEQKQISLKQAEEELEGKFLGENTSEDKITMSLKLPELLQEGAVEANYCFSDYQVFYPDGTLHTQVKEPVIVELTAELTCQGESNLVCIPMLVVPKEKGKTEGFTEKLQLLLEQENAKKGTKTLMLPNKVEGKKVTWKENTENRSIVIAMLGGAAGIGMLLSEKEKEKKRQQNWHNQMLLDYPKIVSEISLLIGAGMNLNLAWEKIVHSYVEKKKRGNAKTLPAYEEMAFTLNEIKEGVGEIKALEHFGERCKLKEYRKLSSLLAQNVRRGNKGLQKMLEEEERESFQMRKARAQKAGEEAGTKLLLPMMMMLVIVLVILMVPAMVSMKI